jgi:hypothetical protein
MKRSNKFIRFSVLARVFLVVPLALFAISVFLPCLSAGGESRLMEYPLIYPPMGVTIQYWSYQVVTFVNGARTEVLMFHDYWFSPISRLLSFLQVMLPMFVFQVITLASVSLCLIKERCKGLSLPLVGAVISSGIVAICNYYVTIQMKAVDIGLNDSWVRIGLGFFLALVSFVLLSTLLIINVVHAKWLAHVITSTPLSNLEPSSKM